MPTPVVAWTQFFTLSSYSTLRHPEGKTFFSIFYTKYMSSWGVDYKCGVCSAAALAAAMGPGLSPEQQRALLGAPACPPCATSRPIDRARETALFHPAVLYSKANPRVWDVLCKTAGYPGHSTAEAVAVNREPLLGSPVQSMSDEHVAGSVSAQHALAPAQLQGPRGGGRGAVRSGTIEQAGSQGSRHSLSGPGTARDPKHELKHRGAWVP